MPSPVRGQSGDRPITQIPSALADMLAAALRGGVKATMGMPGDLEGLGRAGLNMLGADVDPTPALPTSDFMNEWLPSDGGRMPTAEKLGEFLPLPATLGVGQAAKQVGPMVKALRGAEAPVDMGRRDALQTMGKAGAGVAAATVAPHMMVGALRAAPEAGAVAKAVAPTVARAATAWSADALLNAVPHMRRVMGGAEDSAKAVHPNTLALAQKVFKNPEELKNVDGWMKHWEEPDGNIDKFAKGFDAQKAHEAWYDEMIKTGVEPVAIPTRDTGNPGLTYSLDPEFKEVAETLRKKHFPDSSVSPEFRQYEANRDFLSEMPHEKLLQILKDNPPGRVPPELAARGITAQDLAYHIAPIRGRSGPVTDVEKLMDEISADLGHWERDK